MAPSEWTLQHEANRQDNGYHCGPAATRIALTTRGVYVDERVLAGKLGTATAGTNSSADVVRCSTQYVGAVYDDVYIPGETAAPAEIDTMVKDRVLGRGRLWPRRQRRGHRSGHRRSPLHLLGRHYVAVCGYGHNGDHVLVTDVAMGRDYWMTAPTLTVWCARRGYAFAANAPVEARPLRVPPIEPGAPFPLQTGHYYGDINGPAESHGGYHPTSVRWSAPSMVVDGKVGPVTWSAFPRTPAAPAVAHAGRAADPAVDVVSVTP